jgi:hypothetical protein
MPYPPNQYVGPNAGETGVYDGGTPGQVVTNGQYAFDWLTSIGGTVELFANDNGYNLIMPFLPDNTPTPIPQDLLAIIQNNKQSFIAASQNIAYPPLPSPDSCC